MFSLNSVFDHSECAYDADGDLELETVFSRLR